MRLYQPCSKQWVDTEVPLRRIGRDAFERDVFAYKCASCGRDHEAIFSMNADDQPRSDGIEYFADAASTR